MEDFAYICFVNHNPFYIFLLNSTIQSVIHFSKYKIIIYAIDCPASLFIVHDQVVVRHINAIPEIKCIYYYKPWIIADAIENGLQAGYYIECDDVITRAADNYLLSQLDKCSGDVPISPIHPNDVEISSQFMANLKVKEKTQEYIHGHVLFTKNNLNFVKDWFNSCLVSWGECWDESVLNCMYWKAGCKNHYLPIIDPYWEQYYSRNNDNDKDNNIVVSYHGCKEPHKQFKLFMDLLGEN